MGMGSVYKVDIFELVDFTSADQDPRVDSTYWNIRKICKQNYSEFIQT